MKKLLLIFFLIPFINFSQVQIGQDIDGEAAGDASGRRVSLSSDGSIVAIGSPGNAGNGSSSGHVRVFENQGGNWVQVGQDIDGEAAGDSSGHSVSLSSDGSIVAIGSPGNAGNGYSSGHVRVYENQGGNWVQVGQDIDGEAAGDSSGYSVYLSSDGSTVVIGVFYNDNSNGLQSGHARIFENQGGNWVQIGQDIDGEAANDGFGRSVSISSNGSIVAVGSPNNDGNGSSSGHVRIFENQGGNWVQIGQDIDGEAAGDRSGFSVSLSSNGSIIAIGASNNDGNGSSSGHVRIFENQGGNWVQIGQDIDGEADGDGFGRNVRLSSDGNIVAIGAIFNDGINGSDSGHARVFKNQGGNWVQIGQDIDGEAENDLSGFSVSLSSNGSIIAIGANVNNGNGENSGHVRIYSIESELGLLEVVEDIAGNVNGVNITAEQLNAIIGVSGAIDGVNYTTALQNGTYGDPNNPTALEIQAIIDEVNATLGIRDLNSISFILYPNPTKNQFTIQLENSLDLQNINIYNNTGQLVLTTKETTVDTSKLASGLYVVEIKTTKGKGSKKLIIE